jgi:hypothetical protein
MPLDLNYYYYYYYYYYYQSKFYNTTDLRRCITKLQI